MRRLVMAFPRWLEARLSAKLNKKFRSIKRLIKRYFNKGSSYIYRAKGAEKIRELLYDADESQTMLDFGEKVMKSVNHEAKKNFKKIIKDKKELTDIKDRISKRTYKVGEEALATVAYDDIVDDLSAHVNDPINIAEVDEDLAKRTDLSIRQTEALARWLIHKKRADETKSLMEETGFKYYRWATVGDDDVRDSHKAVNGKIFSYDNPPPVGAKGNKYNPGEDYGCRCSAFPVTEEQARKAGVT